MEVCPDSVGGTQLGRATRRLVISWVLFFSEAQDLKGEENRQGLGLVQLGCHNRVSYAKWFKQPSLCPKVLGGWDIQDHDDGKSSV